MLIYNPALISASQLPTSVMQLADPKYKGKLAIAPGETDFQPIVTAVERAYGQAATLSVAGRGQGERQRAQLPGQRDRSPTR